MEGGFWNGSVSDYFDNRRARIFILTWWLSCRILSEMNTLHLKQYQRIFVISGYTASHGGYTHRQSEPVALFLCEDRWQVILSGSIEWSSSSLTVWKSMLRQIELIESIGVLLLPFTSCSTGFLRLCSSVIVRLLNQAKTITKRNHFFYFFDWQIRL